MQNRKNSLKVKLLDYNNGRGAEKSAPNNPVGGASMPYNYNYSMIADKNQLFSIRKEMVSFYKETASFRNTAEFFRCNFKTVMKFVKRHEKYGLDGLRNEKRIPHSSPDRTPDNIRGLVLLIREITGFGHDRMKNEFPYLPISASTIYRILKRACKVDSHRKHKAKKKNDLREIKKKYKPLLSNGH